MKISITFLILFLSHSLFAEDIKDFEIEGISLRNSLLDYISLSEIKNNYSYSPFKNNEYTINVLKINNLKNYDSIEVTYKTNDPNYIIYQITGLIFYENEREKCKNKKNEIFLDIEKLFNSENIEIDHYDTKHSYDTSGKSLNFTSSIKFNSGDHIMVECYDWSKEIEKKQNWADNVRVLLIDNLFIKWLQEVQYN